MMPSESRSKAAVVAACCIAVAPAAVYVYKKWRLADAPPGPTFFAPLIGESIEFIASPMQWAWKRYKKYKSGIFRAHVLGFDTVIVGDPDMIRYGLSDLNACEFVMPFVPFKKVMGSMYNRRQPNIKPFRKQLLAAINTTTITKSLPLFDQAIAAYVSQWFDSSQEFPGYLMADSIFRSMIMDLALTVVAGFNVPREELQELSDMGNTFQAAIFCAPIYLPGTTWYKSWQVRPRYFARIERFFTERFPPGPDGQLRLDQDQGGHPGLDTSTALVKELIEIGRPLKGSDLAERTAQNVLGATETTAAVILGMMVVTAVRPDVQAKLREEQARVIAAHGTAIDYALLKSSMPYCEAVVKETLKLISPAHLIFRRTKTDMEVGGYHLKEDTLVTISIDLLYAIDAERRNLAAGAAPNSPATGTDSQPPAEVDDRTMMESFCPERWLEQDAGSAKLHAFAYGPHSCLGKDVAMMEAILMLAHVARQGTWRLLDCPKPDIRMVPWIHLAQGRPKIQFMKDPITP